MDDEIAREFMRLHRDQLEAANELSAEVLKISQLSRGIAKAIRSALTDLEPIVPGITERALSAFTTEVAQAEVEAIAHRDQLD